MTRNLELKPEPDALRRAALPGFAPQEHLRPQPPVPPSGLRRTVVEYHGRAMHLDLVHGS